MKPLAYIHSYTKHNDELLFVSSRYSELMSYNLVNKQTKIVADFKWIKEKKDGDVYVVDDLVIIAALNATQIGIYNLDTKENNVYIWNCNSEQYSRYTCLRDGKIWFFPYKPDGSIVVFDIKQREFCVVLDLSSCGFLSEKDDDFVYGNPIGESDIIFNGMGCSSVYKYSFAENEMIRIDINTDETIFGITSVGNDIYMTSDESSKIYVTDVSFADYKEYEFDRNVGRFGKPIYCHGGLILFGKDAILHFRNDEFTEVNANPKVYAKNTWFFSAYDYGNNTTLFPWTSEYLLTIDWKNNTTLAVYARCPDGLYVKNNRFLKERADEVTMKYDFFINEIRSMV